MGANEFISDILDHDTFTIIYYIMNEDEYELKNMKKQVAHNIRTIQLTQPS